jgi:hypothetical protein
MKHTFPLFGNLPNGVVTASPSVKIFPFCRFVLAFPPILKRIEKTQPAEIF